MDILNRKKKEGFTLIETLLALTVLGASVAGGIVGYTKLNNYLEQKSITKDITTVLRAVDSRVSIDGYSYGLWKGSDSLSGLSDVSMFIKQNFISRHDPVCGQADGWEPQLDEEKNRRFVDCDFWNKKLPFNADITINKSGSSQGFLNRIELLIDIPAENTSKESLQERFKTMMNVSKSLQMNDYANKNGINEYNFVNAAGEKLSSIECSQAGEDCFISASWNKQGFYESLKVSSDNSMIASSVSFIVNKNDHNELTDNCLLWEEQSNGDWTSSETECGIGLYSIERTANPTTVHLPINESSNVEKVILNKMCDVFSRQVDNGVMVSGKSPCGLLAPIDPLTPSARKVVQVVDTIEVPNMTIAQDLYSEDVQNVDVVKVAIALYNNLTNSKATLNDVLTVKKNTIIEGATTFLKNLKVGDETTLITDKMISIGDLELFGSYFKVNETAHLKNVVVDGTASPDPLEVQVLRAFNDDPNVLDLRTDYFVPNSNYKIGDPCPNTSAFTVDKTSNVVLTCRQDWQDPTKKTWQSNYYGEIASFRESCPTGWNQIEDVHSRFLMGTGEYSELYMAAELYLAREKGGEAFVGLSIDQMPEHHHATPKFDHICQTCHRGVAKEDCPYPYSWSAPHNACITSQGLSKTRDGQSVFSNDSERMSTYVGGNMRHNNLPQYLAVAYCVYAEGDGQSPNLNTPPVVGPDWVPYEPELSGWIDDDVTRYYNCGESKRDYSFDEGIWYTKTQCFLDQYQIEKEREIDLNSGNIRFTGGESRNFRTVVETQIYKEQPLTYGDWENISQPYNCSMEKTEYDSTTNDYYRVKQCDVDQQRYVYRYEKDLRFSELRLMPEVDGVTNPYREYQTIRDDYKRIVAAGGFEGVKPEDLLVTEGPYGTTTKMNLTISLNKAFDTEVVYRVNTQDITTTSILSETKDLIFDEYGNPFISVVDNQNGGRLMFDGGFPKYYNTYWKNPKKFEDMPTQFQFLYNVVNWVSETHKDRGRVLFYGDRDKYSASYNVKSGSNSGFRDSIPGVIKKAGFKVDVKNYEDFGGSYGGAKAKISLEEMSKYSSIVVMSSGGWNSLSNDTANNFTTFVNNGGGVYIITDHDWFQPTGNQILKKFGSEFYGVVNRHSSNNAYKVSTILNALDGSKYGDGHPLWEGLSRSGSIHAGWSEGNVRLFKPVQDLVAFSQELHFAPGETKKEIQITINGDNLAEGDEQFKILLSNPESGVIIGNSELIVTIVDDDLGVKSMSSSCGLGVMSFNGTCYQSTTEPLSTKMVENDAEKETVKGTIKLRYNEFGDRTVTAAIGDFTMSAQCNSNTLLELINENSKSTKETGDGYNETRIESLTFTKEFKWISSMVNKETFEYKTTDCKDLPKDFDANYSVEAVIEKKVYQSVADCDGTIKDGFCITEKYYEPTITCGTGYSQVEDWCIKK